jgi:hypothetical protein
MNPMLERAATLRSPSNTSFTIQGLVHHPVRIAGKSARKSQFCALRGVREPTALAFV